MRNDLEISVRPGKDLSQEERAVIFALFDQSYEEANHDYLMASFDVMRWIALAYDGEHLAGFAVGDGVLSGLPRMTGEQLVAMAGIACIDEGHRRTGLFGLLSVTAIMECGLFRPEQPFLMCGRMAHAASYRAMVKAGTNCVPRAGKPISPWQRDVIAHVAALYDVKVDLKTSRVIGKGKPIGYPRLDLHPTPDEEAVFADVQREKGDSLLALSWRPHAPQGWQEVS